MKIEVIYRELSSKDEQILKIVAGTPGLHQSEIAKRIGISSSTVRHRLRKLELEGLIKVERSKLSVRIFPCGVQEIKESVPSGARAGKIPQLSMKVIDIRQLVVELGKLMYACGYLVGGIIFLLSSVITLLILLGWL